MLKVEDLTFSYNRNRLISGLSFEGRPGECVVLAGPNGSGKSTVLSLVAGVLKPQSGSIRREGRLALVPQGTALFQDMTVKDNLEFFASLSGARMPQLLPFGVDAWLNKRVSKLSGGTAKRVSLACALLGDPEILLLDEPCSGLDLVYREELTELILSRRREGKLTLYVGHEPQEFAPFWDRLIFLGGKAPQIISPRQISDSIGDAYSQQEALFRFYRELCLTCEQEKKE